MKQTHGLPQIARHHVRHQARPCGTVWDKGEDVIVLVLDWLPRSVQHHPRAALTLLRRNLPGEQACCCALPSRVWASPPAPTTVLEIARIIADMEGRAEIKTSHISEVNVGLDRPAARES